MGRSARRSRCKRSSSWQPWLSVLTSRASRSALIRAGSSRSQISPRSTSCLTTKVVTVDAPCDRYTSASQLHLNDHCLLRSPVSSSSSHHEDCIEQLEELLPDSTSPSCAFSFFISQNWEGGRPGPPGHGFYNVRGAPHPDNKLNTKVLLSS
jgi:hypothetical protein